MELPRPNRQPVGTAGNGPAMQQKTIMNFHPTCTGTLRRGLRTALLATAMALLMQAAPARAAVRLPVIIQIGEVFYPVAPLPADVSDKPLMAGYKCGHLGVFWANVWTSNCRLVAMIDDHSWGPLPIALSARRAADARYGFDQEQRGLWHRYAFWGPVALVVGGLAAVLLMALLRVLGERKRDPHQDSPKG